MARLSPRMGILFRFFAVAYSGQRTFKNERSNVESMSARWCGAEPQPTLEI